MRRRPLAVCTAFLVLLSGIVAVTPAAAAGLTASAAEQVFSAAVGASAPSQTLTIRNEDSTARVLQAATLTGTDAADFRVSGLSGSRTLAAGEAVTLTTGFAPAKTGALSATLTVPTDTAPLTVPLFGLAAKGLGGSNEPTLAEAVATLGHPVDVGGSSLALGTGPAPIGAEVAAPLFRRAGTAPVVLQPVARYSPDEALPFGWYTHGATPDKHQVASVDAGTSQTLHPRTTGSTTFDPGPAPFGVYLHSAHFGRSTYTEDALNTGPTAHAARVYPLHTRSGAPVANGYLVAFEDAANGDYQDWVFRITGVTPVVPSPVARISFRTSGSTPPAGYTADTGAAYTASTGQGWVTPGTSTPVSMSTNTRLRSAPADLRQRGLVLMQGSGASTQPGTGAFELAVPSGSYRVTASVGDNDHYDSTHTLRAEGALLVDAFVPTSATRFRKGIVDVTVTDGRLTVLATGTNTKLNYVDVDRLPDGTAPADTTAPTVRTSLSGTTAEDGSYPGSATVTISASDSSGIAAVRYRVDGGTETAYTSPFTVSGVGSHTVTARAVDGAGNSGEAAPVTFTVSAPPSGSGLLDVRGLDGAPFADRLVMSRIQVPEDGTALKANGTCCIPANVVHDTATVRLSNTGTGPLTVSGLAATTGFALVGPPALPQTLAAGASLDVTVRFTYNGTARVTNGSLTVTSDDPTAPKRVVQLAGLWQQYSERNAEANLTDIVRTFGYTTSILRSGQSINGRGLVQPVGDEVLSPYWVRSDTAKPITVRQLAAFHTQGNTASISYFTKSAPTTKVGTLTHIGVDGQTVFPRRSGATSPSDLATTTWSPTTPFGVRIDNETTVDAMNDSSVDTTNGCPGPCGHHVRTYPAYDRSGALLPDTWLVAMDYSGINYDYQDNLYLVTNMRPEKSSDDPSGTAVLPGARGTALDFEAPVAGTTVDADGQGTGFLETQRNRLDTTAGSSSSQPARLDVTGGALVVTTTTGSSGAADNTLVNGLQVAVDASAETATVSARLRGPFTAINAGAEQQGIAFGPGQDDFAKLAVINSGGNRKVQLYGEQGGTGAEAGASPLLPAAAASVDLHLVLDPAASAVRAWYRVDGGPLTAVPGAVQVPATRAGRWFSKQGRAGIVAIAKGGTSFPATYESFAVVPDDVSAPDGPALARFDIGSTTAYTDSRGQLWASDAGTFTPTSAPAEGGSTTVSIDNTDDDLLYQTYRGNVGTLTPRTISFALPVRDTTSARVRLHFAERASGNNAAGKRVFSVAAEGRTYSSGLDLFAAAGGQNTAVTLTLPDSAITGGRLDLVLTASKDYPSLAGVEVLDQTPAPVAPAAPTGVTASEDTAGAVTVRWTASSSSGVTGYDVHRSTTTPVPTTGTPVNGSTPVTGTSYVDTSTAESTRYSYVVVARSAGGSSSPSSPATVTTRDTTPPGQVLNLGAVASTSSIALTWDALSAGDLAGYRVFRSTSSPVAVTGNGLSGTLLTTTSYTDTTAAAGTRYSYVVVAEDTAGNRGAPSSEVLAAAGDTIAPSAPQGVGVALNGAGTAATLTWNANAETDLASYAVHRSTSSPVDTTGTPLAGAAALTTTSFTDDTVAAGQTYWYAVTATDTSGNRSAGSTSTRLDVPAATEPVSLNVDFTTTSGRLATGYLRDAGQPFGSRTGADQGSGLSYGWVVDGSKDPLDLRPNARDITSGANTTDQRRLSFMHAQYPAETTSTTAVVTPGAWEVAVPNGSYVVTVGVGDPRGIYDSSHTIGIEAQNGLAEFVPTSTTRQRAVTRTVHVGDGRLTLSPRTGVNTKLTYVDIASVPVTPARPRVASVAPADLTEGTQVDASVTAELALTSGGLDAATVTDTNVRLSRVPDGTGIPVKVNTSGGGDVIVLTPSTPLTAQTTYRFDVGSGVRDTAGAAMLPWSSTFTTGDGSDGTGLEGVAFTKAATTATGEYFTSVVVGPDRRLYAGTLFGSIYRFPIHADGDLGAPQVIDTVTALNGGAPRTIIGLAFAPGSTASSLELWVTDNAPYLGTNDVPDWEGKIDRLTGPDLQVGETVVVGLPRSNRDHETNSLAFGPDGALYVTQGSNTAMGAPDSAWGNRPERTLSAAVLRLDLARLPGALPLDVKTEEGGTYDPRPATAPLRLHATGVRNAYDLVWHSNGSLYVPTNGSAANGNTPRSPSTLPESCKNRIDAATHGAYTGPAVPGLSPNPQAETDYVFNVHAGGYYGHPVPVRCEWVLNGGNPTSAADPWETSAYPVGTSPDRNYRAEDVYDAGMHASANGALEYRGNAFGGALKGKLLVVRYSAGQDVMVLDPSGPGGGITRRTLGVTGLTGFNEPLDLAQDAATGTLYVTELGGQRITRLTPAS